MEPRLAPSDDVPLLPAALPLRRPRSPESVKRERRSDDSGSDRAPNPNHKFGPPGTVGATNRNARAGATSGDQAERSRPGQDGKPRSRAGQNDRDSGRNGRANDRNDNRRQNHDDGERPARLSDRLDNRGERKLDNRQPPKEEEFNTKSAAKPEPKPEDAPAPKPKSPAVPLSPPKLQPRVAAKAAPKEEPKAAPPVAPDAVSNARPLVPKDALVELLSVSDTFTLSVECLGAECRAGAGFVCLALSEQHSEQYMQLVGEEFTARCEASPPVKAEAGETFVYLNESDGGWYRARRVSQAEAALLDGSKLAPLAPDRCRALPQEYKAVPEFSCLLRADQAQIGDYLTCTVVSKSGSSLNVSLVNAATGAPQGSGAVQRWAPAVDYPAPAPAAPAAAPAALIPEVPRPALAHKSAVLLVDATAPERLFVRDARADLQAEFDDVGMEVAVYGITAVPLKEPPAVGQTVVAKFTDGVCYRALCRRVNSRLNKYLLEYIEYGNSAVAFLEDLYPCPEALSLAARPTLVSQAALQVPHKAFSPAAADYLTRLKDESVELTLTLPSGSGSAPSGSAVCLSVAQSGEDVNRAVSALCTPEWLKLMQRGGDVMEVRAPVYSDITYVDLPSGSFELEVLDTSALVNGDIGGYERGASHAAKVFALSDRLEEYCSSALCKDPYLPNAEELCVAFCPKRKVWVRATLLQQVDGAGGATADLLLFDYGEVVSLPVSQLRKMMPEFVTSLPAAIVSMEIKDFPKEPTEAQLALAKQHMKINDRGVGTLRVARAHKQLPGEYVVEAPELLQAMACA